MDHVEARVPPSRTSTTSSNRWAEAEGRMRTMGRPDAGNSARAAAEAAAAARQALRNSANGQASAPEASNSLAQRDGRNGFTAAESHKRAHSGRNDDYDLPRRATNGERGRAHWELQNGRERDGGWPQRRESHDDRYSRDSPYGRGYSADPAAKPTGSIIPLKDSRSTAFDGRRRLHDETDADRSGRYTAYRDRIPALHGAANARSPSPSFTQRTFSNGRSERSTSPPQHGANQRPAHSKLIGNGSMRSAWPGENHDNDNAPSVRRLSRVRSTSPAGGTARPALDHESWRHARSGTYINGADSPMHRRNSTAFIPGDAQSDRHSRRPDYAPRDLVGRDSTSYRATSASITFSPKDRARSPSATSGYANNGSPPPSVLGKRQRDRRLWPRDEQEPRESENDLFERDDHYRTKQRPWQYKPDRKSPPPSIRNGQISRDRGWPQHSRHPPAARDQQDPRKVAVGKPALAERISVTAQPLGIVSPSDDVNVDKQVNGALTNSRRLWSPASSKSREIDSAQPSGQDEVPLSERIQHPKGPALSLIDRIDSAKSAPTPPEECEPLQAFSIQQDEEKPPPSELVLSSDGMSDQHTDVDHNGMCDHASANTESSNDTLIGTRALRDASPGPTEGEPELDNAVDEDLKMQKDVDVVASTSSDSGVIPEENVRSETFIESQVISNHCTPQDVADESANALHARKDIHIVDDSPCGLKDASVELASASPRPTPARSVSAIADTVADSASKQSSDMPPEEPVTMVKEEQKIVEETSVLSQTMHQDVGIQSGSESESERSDDADEAPTAFDIALSGFIADDEQHDGDVARQCIRSVIDDNLRKSEGVMPMRISPVECNPDSVLIASDIELHNHELLSSFLEASFLERDARRTKHIIGLRRDYKSLDTEWQVHCTRLEKIRDKQGRRPDSVIAPLTPAVNAAGMSLMPPPATPSLLAPNARLNRRSAAAGPGVSDSVRSDAELADVVAMIFEREMQDPKLKAIRLGAVVPNMIVSPDEQIFEHLYSDTNRLIQDPEAHYEVHKVLDNWTQDEVDIFCRRYAMYPKQFGKIASALPDKSFQDCVLFYYRNKGQRNFRALVDKRSKDGKKKKARRVSEAAGASADSGQQKKVSSSLLSNLKRSRADEEEEDDDDDEPQTPGTALAANEAAAAAASEGLNAQIEDSRRQALVGENDVGEAKSGQVLADKSLGGANRKLTRFLSPPSRASQTSEAGLAPLSDGGFAAVEALGVLAGFSTNDNIAGPTASAKQKRRRPSVGDRALDHAFADENLPKSAGNKRSKVHSSSYWSVADKNEFMRLLAVHGKNYSAIATGIETKTAVQCKNFFQNNTKKLGLAQVAAQAEDTEFPDVEEMQMTPDEISPALKSTGAGPASGYFVPQHAENERERLPTPNARGMMHLRNLLNDAPDAEGGTESLFQMANGLAASADNAQDEGSATEEETEPAKYDDASTFMPAAQSTMRSTKSPPKHHSIPAFSNSHPKPETILANRSPSYGRAETVAARYPPVLGERLPSYAHQYNSPQIPHTNSRYASLPPRQWNGYEVPSHRNMYEASPSQAQSFHHSGNQTPSRLYDPHSARPTSAAPQPLPSSLAKPPNFARSPFYETSPYEANQALDRKGHSAQFERKDQRGQAPSYGFPSASSG